MPCSTISDNSAGGVHRAIRLENIEYVMNFRVRCLVATQKVVPEVTVVIGVRIVRV
jgi:hypothetical protein